MSTLQTLYTPKVYGYTTNEYKNTPWIGRPGVGLIKVGYTRKGDVEERLKEQFPTSMPTLPYELLFVEDSVVGNAYFDDRQVHKVLESQGCKRVNGEWFECTIDELEKACRSLRTGNITSEWRYQSFGMRPEQEKAVELSADYFRKYSKEATGRVPKFLWNAKMRFGKTFTSYQLAKHMGWKRILVLTYKPAVQSAWEDDLKSHKDFEGWQFLGRGETFDSIDERKPYVWFASFQDVLRRAQNGSIKQRLEAMHLTTWDCVILDEYHFGAWRETAKEIYDSEQGELVYDDADTFDAEALKFDVQNYLYLSGTPFRALANGEFTEDQIFSWTYSDEQASKEAWSPNDGPNPYEELPKMLMMTYQLPTEIRRVAQATDQDEFDLNMFFKAIQLKNASGRITGYKFVHERDVHRWLNLIRGQYLPFDTRFEGDSVAPPPIPFDDQRLLAALRHTFWFLPDIASCFAMRDLLKSQEQAFFHDYEVIVAAGDQAGVGLDALPPVRDKITHNGLQTRSITLSCGKLTTGVTVPEWSGILMLRNLSSPETYFQAAFRVQSPWTVKNVDPVGGRKSVIIKPICYVFDFAPNRALRLVSEYATQLDPSVDKLTEKKVEEFLHFLPVLCFDGYSMQELKAGPLLDFVVTGTASTMLAKRWQSFRLIDVSNEALERLIQHDGLMKRLEEFENFRNLSKDITKTINAERSLKKLKAEKKDAGEGLTKDEKKKITDEEREAKGFKKMLKENLMKFASRVPVFMYLTDFREETLKHVITDLEPELFRKVTNLDVSDFTTLCEVGVFNVSMMDSAVYAFRRFEDASLNYAGGGHEATVYGGFIDSYATREDVITQEV